MPQRRAGEPLREDERRRRRPPRPAPRPSASRSAVSSESARRAPRVSRTTRRSTTTSIVCFLVLASSISSESSRSCPLTRTRTYPCRRRSKKSFRYSPLRPRTTGASTSRRLPAGSVSTRSTICCTVCAAMTSPHSGQWGMPIAREQHAEVVVDLGDGADRRARVLRRRLLLDGDGGREPLDRVDVGLLHLLEELARVGGERLDVAPLALGVDRVEGERGLARPGQPGDDDELVAGNARDRST